MARSKPEHHADDHRNDRQSKRDRQALHDRRFDEYCATAGQPKFGLIATI